MSQHKHQVVFCHNDMQEGNILLRQTKTKRELMLIDFEFAAYNYRGFDMANHFVEWQYDYTAPEYPFYYERQGAEPTDEQKVSCASGVFGLSIKRSQICSWVRTNFPFICPIQKQSHITFNSLDIISSQSLIGVIT